MSPLVIVSNVGAFSELPDDCCVKVDVGPKEEDSLLAQLLSLARDSDLRQQIGLNAQRHVQAHHRIEDSAQGYITFVEQCLESVKRSGTRPPRFSLRRSFDQSTGLIGTH